MGVGGQRFGQSGFIDAISVRPMASAEQTRFGE
jgi:hypothetical protein